MDKIKCPKCGELVEISEAFRHEVEEGAVKEAENKLKKRYEEEMGESEKKYKNLLEQLTEMNRMNRDLKRKDEERALEFEKKMAAEENKIREEAKKQAGEEQYLKNLEIQKQLQDALKVNEELKNKLQQGSQQNQGEVMELDIENILRNEFITDKITPVGKGVRGADIIQEVWDKNGNNCGKIVWESKNAKWSDGWIAKLKEDQRQEQAETAILVTENMPEENKSAIYKDGIWVIKRSSILPIAYSMRFGLVQIFHVRKNNQGKNEKAEILFNYMSGTVFKQRIETVLEAFTETQLEIEKERRWFSTKWARQEKSLRKVVDHMQGMYGDLQGIIGASLPDLKSIEPQQDKLLLDNN